MKPIKPVKQNNLRSSKMVAELPTPMHVKRQTTGLSSIRFVRYRMFYGKPVLNAKGSTTFGHRPVHILNRLSQPYSFSSTVHLMKHVFPRQFDLHNVFVSRVDPKESGQPFKDYTLREQEIKQKTFDLGRKRGANTVDDKVLKDKVPKRLRGKPCTLIQAIHKRHTTCAYAALLHHYCPVQTSSNSTFDLATPIPGVSAFCRAVVQRVFPSSLWGDGDQGGSNRTSIMRSIDNFIKLRRYEGMTLHDVLSGVKVGLHKVDYKRYNNCSYSVRFQH